MTLDTCASAVALSAEAAPLDLPTVEVWTDGSCRPNPGDGGSAAILRRSDGVERELACWMPDTTNNRAELMAAIIALEFVPDRRRMIMHVDSEYVQNNATRHLPLWKLNDWKTAKKKAVLNRDLWERLDAAASRHEVVWRWVEAHGDNDMNNRADALATKAREGQKGKPGKVSVTRIGSDDAHSLATAANAQQ